MEGLPSLNSTHTVSLDKFCPCTVTSSIFLKVLETRVSGLSSENRTALNNVLRDWPETKEHCAQPSSSITNYTFPNDELESIYKVQLWQRRNYQDDVLRDMLQQNPHMNVHFCVYTHLFRFTQQHVEFLQEEKVLLELAKAAIWVSEILRSLSLYATCLPVYLLPVLLAGYPHRKLLSRIAPGIFVFDMLHLFPELFPFCTKHPDTCKNFCLSYDLSLVGRNRIIKLIGGVLTLTPLSRLQMTTLFDYVRKLDNTAPASFAELLNQAKFLFKSVETDWFDLNRERIALYKCEANGSASSSLSAEAPAYQPISAGTGLNDKTVNSSRNSAVSSALSCNDESFAFSDDYFEDGLLDQPEMIVKLGVQIFRQQQIEAIEFSKLVIQINEKYQEVGDCGVSKMDILNSLKESSKFSFSPDNSVVRFKG